MSAKPITVLHLFTTLPVGGAENLLLSVLRHLDPRRYRSIVCCIRDKDVIGQQVEGLGFPVFELGLLRHGGLDRRIVARLVELMEREHVDLLHSHLYHANLYGRLAAKRLGIPAVASIHNTYKRHKLHRQLLGWYLARHTARIIAGSEDIQRDIVRYDRVAAGRIEVIPNAVDLSRSESALDRSAARARLGLGAESLVLGTVGRLEQQKGHRFLLDALALLQEDGLQPVLLLIGDGRERERLEAQAARLGISDRVHMLGTRTDLGDLFRAMDLFVMPSLWEGLSLAMLSAMGAGLPVIATAVGGVPEVMADGRYGVMVPAGDAPALARAIAAAAAQPERMRELAARGAERVRERYSDRAMVARLAQIYDAALAAARKPSP